MYILIICLTLATIFAYYCIILYVLQCMLLCPDVAEVTADLLCDDMCQADISWIDTELTVEEGKQ